MNAPRPGIILHAGHGKTGTSALQSSLALSQASLLKNGIAYPDHPSFGDARAGNISSGNIEPENITASYDQACADFPDARRILYSTEHFFPATVDTPDYLDALLAREIPIRAILFIRNPLEHAVSSYVQSIKRYGSTASLDGFLMRYKRPVRVLAFITNARRMGLDLEVLNYSNHKRDLKAVFAAKIGVDPSDIADPARPTINRGLTRSELRLQRAFNEAWGQGSSSFISDPLCNELPAIRAEKPLISRALYDDFLGSVGGMVAEANAHLPEGERYELAGYDEIYGDADPEAEERFDFSAAQMEVLARAISTRIPRPDEDAKPAPATPQTLPSGSVRQILRRALGRS